MPLCKCRWPLKGWRWDWNEKSKKLNKLWGLGWDLKGSRCVVKAAGCERVFDKRVWHQLEVLVAVVLVVGVGWTTICADVSTVIILDLECCWTMAAATCPPGRQLGQHLSTVVSPWRYPLSISELLQPPSYQPCISPANWLKRTPPPQPYQPGSIPCRLSKSISLLERRKSWSEC